MPKLVHLTPKYRLHKRSGQAVVTINGRDHYLGRHGSKASKQEYDRLISEWLTTGRQAPSSPIGAGELTIAEMLARYWHFAEQHYRKGGTPTQELDNMRYAVKPLRELYGHTSARDFGPIALKTIQRTMIEAGLCRGVINSRIGKIKRVFRWAVSDELLPPGIHHALSTVAGLQRGRTEARETEPVGPVSVAMVDATLPHLPPVVADIVRFQRLVGCRPGEVCGIRPCDVDTSGDVWCYTPESHKTEHHGKQRHIYIGPKAQDVLRPYLLRDHRSYCFSPVDSRRRQYADMRSRRKTPVQPSHVDRSKRHPKTRPGNRYSKDSYNQAVRRACERAAIAYWHPNQLRHALATEVRERYGLEAAQTVLGHSRADVTQLYAARDSAKAAAIMREVG